MSVVKKTFKIIGEIIFGIILTVCTLWEVIYLIFYCDAIGNKATVNLFAMLLYVLLALVGLKKIKVIKKLERSYSTMNTGKACAIFQQIDSDKYTLEEKGAAIHEVLKMGLEELGVVLGGEK